MNKPKTPILIAALCTALTLVAVGPIMHSSTEGVPYLFAKSQYAPNPLDEQDDGAAGGIAPEVDQMFAPESEPDSGEGASLSESPGQTIQFKDEQPARQEVATKEQFVMPEGVQYEPEVALIEVAPGTTVEELNAALNADDTVVTREVSEEELSSGVIKVELAEGKSVEDAVNSLGSSDVIASAQPNYQYFTMTEQGEGDLKELLETYDEGSLEPPEEIMPPSSNTGENSDDSPSDAADAASLETGQDEAILTAEADGQVEGAPTTLSEALAVSVNDPYAGEQWALESIHAYEAWSETVCDGAVTIAVVDQGPMSTHQDLAENVVQAYDAVEGQDTITSVYRHGTHVAGIASARVDNGMGVAGVSHNANMLIVDVFSGPNTDTSSVVQGMNYVMDHAAELNIRVLNMSIGAGISSDADFSDDLLVKSIKKAYADYGIVVVASAGNKENAPAGEFPFHEYPGDTDCVVSVMNLMKSSEGVTRSATSNYNVEGQKAKNISAPGTDVYSTVSANGYGRSSGTSMAAPHASGVLALEFAANPNLTAQEAVEILYSTATDLGPEGFDEGYGWGEVNALEAVRAAKSGEYDPVPVPDPEPEPEPDPDPDPDPDPEVMPEVKGAKRIPVGATASYKVTGGTIRLASGDAAALEGTTLTGVKEGTVTLAVIDEAGVERSTFDVEVYGLSGYWVIASAINENYVLDIAWDSLVNCGNIIVYPYHAARNEAWVIEGAETGSVYIRSALTGKVLDVDNATKAPLGNILQFTAGNKPWQRWHMTVDEDGYITFVNQNSGLAIDIEGGSVSPGGNVLQYPGHGGRNQKWALKAVDADVGSIWDGVYRIESSINRNFVLDVHGASRENGANVEIYPSNGGSNQQWILRHLGGDVYSITSVCSGKSIDVGWGSTNAGANILQWDYTGAPWQKWWLKPNANGSYSFFRNGTRLLLDACGGNAYPGCNVHQWPQIGSNAQMWWLVQY